MSRRRSSVIFPTIFTIFTLCLSIERCGTLGLKRAAPNDVTQTDDITKQEPHDTWSPPEKGPQQNACRIFPADEFISKRIRLKVEEERVKFIEYTLVFDNYTTNPLKNDVTMTYKADTWTRVTSLHGRTLISLAFNYGILSLMTLTLSTDSLLVHLLDEPPSCFGALQEADKITMVTELLMRDFQSEEAGITLTGDERICSEILLNRSGYAHLTDQCCYRHRLNDQLKCEQDFINIYLRTLYLILSSVRFIVLLGFGPLIVISILRDFVRQEVPYKVKLKADRQRTVMVLKAGEELPSDVLANSVIQLVHKPGFGKLLKLVMNGKIRTGDTFLASIRNYNIYVDSRRLSKENEVDVSLLRAVAGAIFSCRLAKIEPFKACCNSSIVRGCPDGRDTNNDVGKIKWISFWKKIGHLLTILLIPTPYYLRVLVFYLLEYEEIASRKQATISLGLEEKFDNNFIHFLLPTHPVFVVAYCLYFLSAIVMIIDSLRHSVDQSTVRAIIIGALSDLKNFSWSRVFVGLTSTIIWPFHKFGMFGVCVAIVYWPIAIPVTLILCIYYCIPSFYLTGRLLVHTKRQFFDDTELLSMNRKNENTQKNPERDVCLENINFYSFVSWVKEAAKKRKEREAGTSSRNVVQPVPDFRYCRLTVKALLTWTLCTSTFAGMLLMLSECVGFAMEMVVFTVMGIIVNSGTLLKYVALLLLMVVYSYDSFKNVNKKYLKLNKALFVDVMRRSDYKLTKSMLKSQHNRAFRTTVSKDDIRDNLVLFIDREKLTPRIPRHLFDLACEIRVPGVPGPVYRGLCLALRKFLKLTLFILLVFLIVFSFGNAYDISPTNQTIAALAGGSLPLIFRTLMKPEKPDMEIGTVSFQLRMDEVMHQFARHWPICDLSLRLSPHPNGLSTNAESVSSTNDANPIAHDADELSTDEESASENEEDCRGILSCVGVEDERHKGPWSFASETDKNQTNNQHTENVSPNNDRRKTRIKSSLSTGSLNISVVDVDSEKRPFSLLVTSSTPSGVVDAKTSLLCNENIDMVDYPSRDSLTARRFSEKSIKLFPLKIPSTTLEDVELHEGEDENAIVDNANANNPTVVDLVVYLPRTINWAPIKRKRSIENLLQI